MNWIITIYIALLFFVLTPGVLLRLPAKSGKFVVAATHAVVFALVWHFTYKIVWRMTSGREGFAEGLSNKKLKNMDDSAIIGQPCGLGESNTCRGSGCPGKSGAKFVCLKPDGTNPIDMNDGVWKKK